MTLEIRTAGEADAVAIAAFNCALALETEGRRLHTPRVLAGVRAVLEDPAKGFYLVATVEGEFVGQLLITYEWSDWRNGLFWWVQSAYVPPERRSAGVFRALYADVQTRAEQAGNVCGVRLYVERDNQRAQSLYRRLGLQETGYQVYEAELALEQ